MGIVNEAVEDGVGIGRIADDFMPTVDWKLRSDHGGTAPIAIFEDFKEIVPGGGIERLQPPVVKNEKIGAAEVSRADARRVKAFIRSFGILGKTDAIDARALAQYGRERHAQLARWQPPDRVRDQLQALVLARRDFVTQRTAYTNRLAAPGANSRVCARNRHSAG